MFRYIIDRDPICTHKISPKNLTVALSVASRFATPLASALLWGSQKGLSYYCFATINSPSTIIRVRTAGVLQTSAHRYDDYHLQKILRLLPWPHQQRGFTRLECRMSRVSPKTYRARPQSNNLGVRSIDQQFENITQFQHITHHHHMHPKSKMSVDSTIAPSRTSIKETTLKTNILNLTKRCGVLLQ